MIMICIIIVAIALAGYFARRAKLMDQRRIRASLKSAETEIALRLKSIETEIALRKAIKNLGKQYEKIRAHSMARCSKCGRLYTWKQVADHGNYYVCKNCEAKQWK